MKCIGMQSITWKTVKKSVQFRLLSVLMTASFFLCDRLVYADDTNRVIHVTKRFFSFFMILVTVHIASRTKQKGL